MALNVISTGYGVFSGQGCPGRILNDPGKTGKEGENGTHEQGVCGND